MPPEAPPPTREGAEGATEGRDGAEVVEEREEEEVLRLLLEPTRASATRQAEASAKVVARTKTLLNLLIIFPFVLNACQV